jgi:hypothetical protein
MEKCGRAGQATDDNMAPVVACWITKASNTRSECVIFLTSPQQQWFREHTSSLRLYVHCLFCFLCDRKT